ncbi:MAG: hypothetical protein FGM33_08125 [Candidatus Kapabacteria bacterium]|nr:hypothetical protein [Candidatus Kapabacteria bacterium]
MFESTLSTRYEPQQKLFGRLIRLCFSLAGVYWIVIYAMHWAGSIDAEELRQLRSGQTMIYFVLLTLWGLEYMREVRRLKGLIRRSHELGVPVSHVTLNDVMPMAGSFAVLYPIAPYPASAWIFPIMNIAGLIAAAILIAGRYVAAFAI